MEIDGANTAWVMVSAALVIVMTPGLAFFYGGMVRARHVLNMLMMSTWCMAVAALLWAVGCFSLAFGGTGSLLGNLDYVGLQDLAKAPLDEAVPGLTLTIPPLLFMMYQMAFAVITPALISGAVADRMRFAAWAVFVPLWLLLVYTPVAHWVFAPSGWIFDMGAIDFAGGTVVHINAGVAALAAVLVLGRRKGWPKEAMPPHNLTLTMIGTGLLWFGWFGFNAGSALAADGIAVQAFVNTNLAAAAAMLGWLAVERVKTGHFTTLGAASGAVAGLVAITPCAGFVGGLAPIAIGAIAGVLCFLAVSLKFRFGYDDSLDVVGVHLVGGLAGSILLGVFADASINPAGFDGLLFGETDLLVDQVVACAAVLAFSFVVTFALLKVLDAVMPGGIRCAEEDELAGLDLSQHSEVGYALSELGAMTRGGNVGASHVLADDRVGGGA
jgi:ammonium transporter, Amt family